MPMFFDWQQMSIRKLRHEEKYIYILEREKIRLNFFLKKRDNGLNDDIELIQFQLERTKHK